MSKNSKVSIIIPVYNAEKYIGRCITSIVDQDYSDFELILVDDGSKDESSKICSVFADRDNRVKVIHQNNCGVSVARNVGIKKSTGNYIIFVDADDYLLPGAITDLYNNMLQTKCELVCGSYKMQKTRERMKVISYHDAVYKNEDYDNNFIDILRKIANAPWGKVFDANIIRKNNISFPERIPYAEDTIFLIRYCRCIRSLSVCSEVLYNYNFTDSNSAMRKSYPNLYIYFYLVLKEKEQFFRERKKMDFYNSMRSDEEEYYFEWCMKHYILHSKDDISKKLIENAASALLHNNTSDKYQKFVLEQDWEGLIKKWKKEHWKEILTNKLKRFMNI